MFHFRPDGDQSHNDRGIVTWSDPSLKHGVPLTRCNVCTVGTSYFLFLTDPMVRGDKIRIVNISMASGGRTMSARTEVNEISPTWGHMFIYPNRFGTLHIIV